MNDKKFPETVDEAVQFLLDQIEPENRRQLKNFAEDDLFMLHMVYGMAIRSDLRLSSESALTNTPELRGMQPDDMSSYLIDRLWKLLQDMPLDDDDAAE